MFVEWSSSVVFSPVCYEIEIVLSSVRMGRRLEGCTLQTHALYGCLFGLGCRLQGLEQSKKERPELLLSRLLFTNNVVYVPAISEFRYIILIFHVKANWSDSTLYDMYANTLEVILLPVRKRLYVCPHAGLMYCTTAKYWTHWHEFPACLSRWIFEQFVFLMYLWPKQIESRHAGILQTVGSPCKSFDMVFMTFGAQTGRKAIQRNTVQVNFGLTACDMSRSMALMSQDMYGQCNCFQALP